MENVSGVVTQAIWLNESGEYAPIPISVISVEDVKNRIRMETAKEASLLTLIESEDGNGRHVARREDYPAHPKTMRCCDCKYQMICPEGTMATAHMRPAQETLAAALIFGNQRERVATEFVTKEWPHTFDRIILQSNPCVI